MYVNKVRHDVKRALSPGENPCLASMTVNTLVFCISGKRATHHPLYVCIRYYIMVDSDTQLVSMSCYTIGRHVRLCV